MEFADLVFNQNGKSQPFSARDVNGKPYTFRVSRVLNRGGMVYWIVRESDGEVLSAPVVSRHVLAHEVETRVTANRDPSTDETDEEYLRRTNYGMY